jgi:four helix bundle protein
MSVHKFRELKVRQRSMAFVARVYKVSATFPATEAYGLTSQLRRAATTIPLNIAEGAGSGSDAEFSRFRRIAFRSTYEVMTALDLASTPGFLEEGPYSELTAEVDEIAAMLHGLLASLKASD